MNITEMSEGYYRNPVSFQSRRPRHILSLSADEKRTFLDSFDLVFSDIDGVVWTLEGNISGASEGFNALRSAGKELIFITNNSIRTEEACLQKLKSVKIPIDGDNLIHPAKSVADYLKSIQFEGLIYVLASESFKTVLREAGLKVMNVPNEIINESYSELVAIVIDHQPVQAVVIDYDFNMSNIKLSKAHFFLRNPECLLIAGATDLLAPLTKDMRLLGPGAFGRILQEASSKEMHTFGKPGEALAQMLLKRFRIQKPQRALMIGDQLEQDICFAKICGFQTLLVLSGVCNLEDLESPSNDNFMPDYYADSMFDFVRLVSEAEKPSV